MSGCQLSDTPVTTKVDGNAVGYFPAFTSTAPHERQSPGGLGNGFLRDTKEVEGHLPMRAINGGCLKYGSRLAWVLVQLRNQ